MCRVRVGGPSRTTSTWPVLRGEFALGALWGSKTPITLVTRPSMLSSGQLSPPRVGQEVPVDDVRELSLETPHGLLVGLPRLPLPGHVRLSLRRDPALHQGDVVQGPVQLTVPTAVQAVPVGLARRCSQWGGPREYGEGGLGPNPRGVPHLPQDLGGDERPDPGDVGEAHPGLPDRGFDAPVHGGDLPIPTRW